MNFERTLTLLSLILVSLFASQRCIASEPERFYFCPHILMIGRPTPDFGEVERGLICGEPSQKESPTGGAWAKIPFSQAKYNLKNFLQQRGYHHPLFSQLDENFYQVEIGPQTKVKEVQIQKNAGEIDISRLRKIKNQPLSPQTLDQIERWVSGKLRNQGYACPVVTSKADPDSGEVLIQVQSGPLLTIAQVESEEIPGIKNGILRRYDAFEIGKLYDERLLTLTSNRILSAKLLESTYFTHRCLGDGVHLKQEMIAGRPRLLITGFGVNTEGLLLGRFAWRNTRLGDTASLLDLSVSGSSKLQSLRGNIQWYFLPEVSRFYLNPIVQLNHNNEQHFEVVSTEGQFGFAGTLDQGSIGASYFIGPSLNFYRTVKGIGAPAVHLANLETRITLKSHLFEFYAANPQTGYSLNFSSSLNNKGFLSQVSAQRLSLWGESLWNLNHYEPALWIVGIRGGMTTIFTDEPIGAGTSLPAPYLQYLGGSMNLRGFSRQELSIGSQGGGLTSSFLGLELRLSQTLPAGLDPFLFFDVGALGSRPLSLDSPLYWNPGLGIRWASPVGSLRTTLAQGYSNGVPNHLQFFLSLGEEF